MTLTQLAVVILVGAIAGVLANAVTGAIKAGVLSTIIVGIIGAFVGGWLFDRLKINVGGGLLGDVVQAFVGAVILLIILQATRRK
jgi:uncharacterized membrane protein YeaQ/YmgE (transglycosylase-associated protein family)